MAEIAKKLDEAMKLDTDAYEAAKSCLADAMSWGCEPADALGSAIVEYLSATRPVSDEDAVEEHNCPICDEAFKPNDLCATDIELGICHAACLHGSPTVNLETGEPSDGPIATYRYEEDADKWRIDRSAGAPILTYDNCSVIQDEQAHYVMGLIRTALSSHTGKPDVKPLKLTHGQRENLNFLGTALTDKHWRDAVDTALVICDHYACRPQLTISHEELYKKLLSALQGAET